MCGCAAARVDAAAGPTPARDRLTRGGGGGDDDDDDGNSTERWDCSSDFDEPLAARRERARPARHVAAMGFVGLTELHNASVCPFHRRRRRAAADGSRYRVGRGRRDGGRAAPRGGGSALDRLVAPDAGAGAAGGGARVRRAPLGLGPRPAPPCRVRGRAARRADLDDTRALSTRAARPRLLPWI